MQITFPVVVHIGSFSVSAHLLFETLAYSAGFQIYRIMRRRQGDFLPSPDRFMVMAAALIGAALGSRILCWLEDPALTVRHFSEPAYLMAGKTVVGGLLGGTIAVEWTRRRAGIKRRTGDLFALPITAAIAIGRIGCFCEGLSDRTYGIATSLPSGVDFGDGVRRHPTQLYEILFLTALAVWLRTPIIREGDRFRRFLVAYLVFRLAIDFMKPGVNFAGLTAIQWSCAIAILAYWRDIPYLIAPQRSAQSWVNGSGPISSTTPPFPSAQRATEEATARLFSKTETSIS